MPQTQQIRRAFVNFVKVHFPSVRDDEDHITCSNEHESINLSFQGGLGAAQSFPAMREQLTAAGIEDNNEKRGVLLVSIPLKETSLQQLQAAKAVAEQARDHPEIQGEQEIRAMAKVRMSSVVDRLLHDISAKVGNEKAEAIVRDTIAEKARQMNKGSAALSVVSRRGGEGVKSRG